MPSEGMSDRAKRAGRNPAPCTGMTVKRPKCARPAVSGQLRGGLVIDSDWQWTNTTAKATFGNATPCHEMCVYCYQYMSPGAALRLFTMKATTSPIHKDMVKTPVTVETSPFIPANIIEVDAYVAAAEQNGQEVVDYDMQATKAM